MQIKEQLLNEGIRIERYGQTKTVCPKCSHTRRNTTEPCLSINVEHDIAVWHCHHCDWKGSVYDREKKDYVVKKEPKKENVVPFVPDNKKLSEEARDWLKKTRYIYTNRNRNGIIYIKREIVLSLLT